MARDLSCADAVKLLGGTDSKVVAALGRLTGGVLLAATADGSAFALSLFDPKGEFAKLSGELVSGLAERMRGLGRFDRSERLAAAHKVIVVAGYFEALSAVESPFDLREFASDSSTQLALATGHDGESRRLRAIAEILLDSSVPGDSPRLANEAESAVLRDFYASISERLIRCINEVPAWRSLDDRAKARLGYTLTVNAPKSALADLYERLLISFVEREVRKSQPELTAGPLAAAVEAELLRLSVVAFSMFNRGRQWATEDELSADLAVLLGGHGMARPVANSGFREPATPAQIVVSRFFFIHQAQAIRDDRRLTTCEFLHSTFSEYLIARLTVHELSDLCKVTTVTTSRSRATATDGFFRALLSFAPLTIRAQVVDFLTTQIRRLPDRDTARLRQLSSVASGRRANERSPSTRPSRPMNDWTPSGSPTWTHRIPRKKAYWAGIKSRPKICGGKVTSPVIWAGTSRGMPSNRWSENWISSGAGERD